MNRTKDFIQQVMSGLSTAPLSYDIVSTHGVTWDKAAYVSGGEDQMCFKNSLHLAKDNGWLYAEGWAVPGDMIPLEHAWCVKPDGTIVDSTWKYGSHYFGVVFDTHMAVHLVLQTRYYGILPNLFLLSRKFPDVKQKVIASLSPRYSDGSFH